MRINGKGNLVVESLTDPSGLDIMKGSKGSMANVVSCGALHIVTSFKSI